MARTRTEMAESWEVELQGAIAIAYDDEPLEARGLNHYDNYVPAFNLINVVTTRMADQIWDSITNANGEVDFNWAPASVEHSLRRGMKAGYLWAKAELARG